MPNHPTPNIPLMCDHVTMVCFLFLHALFYRNCLEQPDWSTYHLLRTASLLSIASPHSQNTTSSCWFSKETLWCSLMATDTGWCSLQLGVISHLLQKQANRFQV